MGRGEPSLVRCHQTSCIKLWRTSWLRYMYINVWTAGPLEESHYALTYDMGKMRSCTRMHSTACRPCLVRRHQIHADRSQDSWGCWRRGTVIHGTVSAGSKIRC